MQLTDNATRLMQDRYCMEGETPSESFERVAWHGAKNEEQYKKNLEALTSKKFLPSRMPYMGTEKSFCSSCFVIGPIEDDTQSILNNLNNAIMVQRFGGGTGYNFSNLRPEGDIVKGTRGKASGPVSFMQLYNAAMKVFLRAGNKMGAQMAVLNVNHPDIEKFITCKEQEGNFSTFNISVNVTNDFMQAVKNDTDWKLEFNGKIYKTVRARYLWDLICKNAWTNGEPGIIFIDTVNQNNLFPETIYAPNACQPGFATVLTPDGIRTLNDVEIGNTIWSGKEWKKIVNKWSTGIKPVYMYTSNVGVFVGTEDHKIVINNNWKQGDFANSKTEVETAFQNQDFVVGQCKRDFTHYGKINNKIPLEDCEVYDITVENEEHTYWTGGLLVSNCAEQFIPYNCSCNLGSLNVSEFVVNGKFDFTTYAKYVEIAVDFLNNSLDHAWWPLQELKDNTLNYRNVGLGIMGFADALIKMNVPYESEKALEIAETIMKFTTEFATNYSEGMGYKNTTLTSIAPTGSISMIANCSSSIEPVFNLVYNKNTTIGTMYEVNSVFEELAKRNGFYSEDLIAQIAKQGTAQGIVPPQYEKLLKTANEISPEHHVKMQASFQKYTDNGISKTVNLQNDATQQDVSDVFENAHKLGCKSITIYRDGSRTFQAIDTKIDDNSEQKWQFYLEEHCDSGSCSL